MATLVERLAFQSAQHDMNQHGAQHGDDRQHQRSRDQAQPVQPALQADQNVSRCSVTGHFSPATRAAPFRSGKV